MARRAIPSVVVGLLLAMACARQGAPPGGPADRIPPYVVLTEPDTFAVVDAFDGSVRIEFNERISENASGGMDNAVEVSPRSGEVKVHHRRRGLSVDMEGGFLEGRVYRITVLPVVSDMFNNALPEPFEFFFSTGPDFNPNALAGVLTDRITGSPVPGARVDAWQPGEDSVVYTAVSDQEGVFALRTLPAGTYTLRAYLDNNRNFEANFTELQDSSDGWQLGAADTVFAFRELIQPDTTPANLLTATAVDSLTVELSFDDYLDPDSSLDGVSVTLARDSAEVAEGASEEVPAVVQILYPAAYERRRQEIIDSTTAAELARAAEEAGADTAAALPAPVPQLPTPGVAGPARPAAVPRPAQNIFALLDGPLTPEAVYRVTVTGITNLLGLRDGGGESRLVAPAPPPPPPAPPADTTAVPDTTALPDTAAVDTTAVADTTLVPPGTRPTDTIPVDTLVVALGGSRAAPAVRPIGPATRPLVRRLR